MRSITRAHLRVLNSDEYAPVELMDIDLIGANSSSTIRITNGGIPITWNGNVYTPMNFAHGDVTEVLSTDNSSVPSVAVSIGNIDLQMASLINKHEIEGATVTLRLTDRRLLDNPRDAVILTMGEVRNAQVTEATLIFQIVNIIGLTEKISVPKRAYQAECNYAFGSRSCGMDINGSPISLETTARTGSTRYVIAVDPTIISSHIGTDTPTEYWSAGYVLMMNGPAALQACPIQQVMADGRFFLRRPLLTDPVVGDQVLLRRGCRKTKLDCYYYGNLLNFGGFEAVPYGRIVPTTKTIPNPA